MTRPTKEWLDWLKSMELPSKREGETDEQWTDRIHRSGAALGRFRQCSIGWHDECSDRQGDDCKCPCHNMDKGRLAAACRELEAEVADWHSNIGRMVRTLGREPSADDYTETIAQMSTGFGILHYVKLQMRAVLEQLRENAHPTDELLAKVSSVLDLDDNSSSPAAKLPAQPPWRKFDKDDESTWPVCDSLCWIAFANRVVYDLYWRGNADRVWSQVAYYMPIEVPEPPQ